MTSKPEWKPKTTSINGNDANKHRRTHPDTPHKPMNTDTICAISTAPGVGGIAVARVSGPQAIAIVDSIRRGRPLAQAATHTAHLGDIIDTDGSVLDQALATVMRAPRSYTGEDTVEISVHGSTYVQRRLIETLIAAGARLAEPGEFTRRAFAAGNLDLAQAEAVADLIASRSKAAHDLAVKQMRGGISQRLDQLRARLVDLDALLELELDFSEEDVEFASRQRLSDTIAQIITHIQQLHDSYTAGNAIREGFTVAIAGATNAGKSSLLNALVGDERAIVSDIHGTTRDIIEDTITVGAYTFRLQDTAGIRDRAQADTIEAIGIDRATDALLKADIALVLCPADADEAARRHAVSLTRLRREANPTAHTVLIVSKDDICNAKDCVEALLDPLPDDIDIIAVNTVTEDGISPIYEELEFLAKKIVGNAPDIMISNIRQRQALAEALAAARRVAEALASDATLDIAAFAMRDCIEALAAVTGRISSQEVLNTIFSRFCIGK